jgi:hypothetical protein
MLRQLMSGLLAIAALGSVTPVAAADQTILPGYWSSKNSTTFIITKSSEDRRCITASQVATYITGPSNRHYKCTYGERSVGDGKLALKGQCVDKHGTAYDVSISGAYTPEWFKLKAHFSLSGLPIGGSATTEAHRISEACPGDAQGAASPSKGG